MNNIAHLPPSTDDAKMLALIKRTVAADTNQDEFDLFIHTARHLGLDPLRRQIYAFVFSKDDPTKRKMSIVTAIDGFRTIAERTGNYRPDEDAPELYYDAGLMSPANPLGLVKAVVRVYKFSHGSWHKATAEAYWEEYAPIKEPDDAFDWKDTGEFWPDKKTGLPTNRPKKRKVRREGVFEPVLDTSGPWGKNPRGMLPKCAEALVLRKAWPDAFSGVYAQEEMDKSLLDLLPSEAAQQGAQAERLARIGGSNAILIDWMKGEYSPLESVPVGQLADRAMAFIREHKEEPSIIRIWGEKNRHGLRQFWGMAPGDALAVKAEVEKAIAIEG